MSLFKKYRLSVKLIGNRNIRPHYVYLAKVLNRMWSKSGAD